MSQHYRLEGKKIVPCGLSEWTDWFKRTRRDGSRIVGKNEIDGVKVSTIFIGIDPQFDGDGPPHILETVVFGGDLNGEMERYSTWEEAEAGHAFMVERVRFAARLPAGGSRAEDER